MLQAIYGLRSAERLLLEQLDDNVLYRWFVGLGADKPIWHQTSNARKGFVAFMRWLGAPLMLPGTPIVREDRPLTNAPPAIRSTDHL